LFIFEVSYNQNEMKKILPAIILACFALLLTDCKKKHKHLDVIDMDAYPDIDMHFNYKPGSYWIYRDSATGRTDSFFVRSNYYFKLDAKGKTYNYHFISVADYNVDGTNPKDSSFWQYSYNGNKVIVDYYYGRNGYGWKNDITYDPLFLYPFLLGDNYSNFDTVRVTGIDSVMMIGGQLYYNVAQVHQFLHIDSSAGRGLTYIDDRFSVSDSVGIVKMQLYHPFDTVNHIWELQRYNVMKY